MTTPTQPDPTQRVVSHTITPTWCCGSDIQGSFPHVFVSASLSICEENDIAQWHKVLPKMYFKGTEAQKSLAAAEWHWPQHFSRWELIKVPLKALALLHCPEPSQVLRQNMPKCLCKGNSVQRKAPLLSLWHNCSCEHNLCSTPEFTQVTTATRNWWAKAVYGAVYPRFPVDSRIQPVLRLQLTSTYSMDGKDVRTEVLTCGVRVNGSVGHPHFHPHANSPQCSSKQCRHRCHVLYTEQPHDDVRASFPFLILSQGSTTYNWIVALIPAWGPATVFSKVGCFMSPLK